MTHEEFDQVNETLDVACSDALFYTRNVIGSDAIFLYAPFKGRKGQITDICVTDGEVLLRVQPYRKTSTGISTSLLLSHSDAMGYDTIDSVVLCDDKARYAKYLLTT